MNTNRFYRGKRVGVVAVALVSMLTLAACESNRPRTANYDPQPRYSGSPSYGGGVNYGPNDAQGMPAGYRSLEYGTVEDVQYAGGGASGTSGAGAVMGGVVGGVVGHQAGGSRRARDAATVGGAVLGAIIGNEIERNQRSGGTAQYSVVRVRLENGQVISLEQSANVDVRPGDRVRVYDRRGLARY
ncbi:MAG: glycine zipper 2TM domain-containing protein [Casimicrobium sp.]